MSVDLSVLRQQAERAKHIGQNVAVAPDVLLTLLPIIEAATKLADADVAFFKEPHLLKKMGEFHDAADAVCAAVRAAGLGTGDQP